MVSDIALELYPGTYFLVLEVEYMSEHVEYTFVIDAAVGAS